MKNIIKNHKAITLIALVITIVVLIILAAVAINLSLGNNGIFNRAKTAKEQYANADNYEQAEIKQTTNTIDSIVGGNRYVSGINTQLIKSDWKVSTVTLTTSTATTIETIPLNTYGTGIAIISCSMGSENNNTDKFELNIYNNSQYIATDNCFGKNGGTYRRCNATTTIRYDESSNIIIKAWADASFKPSYMYSILLLPDA